MAKTAISPAYLMYPGDILSSGRVAALKPLEELWYRRALDLGWEHNGMPSDAAEFAGWVGRGCTVAAAEKIIAKFYSPHKKDASKVINPRQEKERKAFNDKRKKTSDERRKAANIRWEKEREKADANVMQKSNRNLQKKTPVRVSVENKSILPYANALQNDAIPIPISIPIPNQDLKRLIKACVRANSAIDPKAVEAGVYYTLLQRNGDVRPINSLEYFAPQIRRAAAESKDLKAAGWESLLDVRRQQVLRSGQVANPPEAAAV